MDTERATPGCLFLVAVVVFSALISSCGLTPRQAARASLDVMALGVRTVDDVSAQAYAERARTALAAAHDMAEYRAAIAPMDDLERALRVADEALLAADRLVAAWDEGGRDHWIGAAACVAEALLDVAAALEAAGLEIPPELVEALEAARILTGTCVVPPTPVSVPVEGL